MFFHIEIFGVSDCDSVYCDIAQALLEKRLQASDHFFLKIMVSSPKPLVYAIKTKTAI